MATEWFKAASLVLAVLVAACSGSSAGQPAADADIKPAAPVQSGPARSFTLGINGFNYTDLAIDLFNVAHTGGGNIFVSSPTSGGGGTTCCVRWNSTTPLPWPIEVEWMRYANRKQRWCKKTVMFNGPMPANPTAIGVHFMPDGDVQIELAEGYPALKLRLENYSDGQRHATGNVIHDEKTASCRDGY
jgi:Protein of unknown function (DUF3304)